MQFIKQRVITIIIGTIVIITIGLYLFLYRPLIKRVNIARLKSKAIEEVLSQAHERIKSARVRDIKKRLIEEEDISFVINELTKRGKLEGINFVSLTPKKVEAVKDIPYRILPIEMEIESSYEELGRFLGSLDKLEKYLVTVQRFDIFPDDENPQKLNTKVIIKVCLKAQNAE